MNTLGALSYCLVCEQSCIVPRVSEFEYGAFVLFSSSGEARGLNAFEDSAFDEVAKLVRDCSSVSNLPKMEQSAIFHRVYAICCDPDSQGQPFRIGDARCPKCGSTYLTMSDEGEHMILQPVTHQLWNLKSRDEQLQLVRAAICD